jgi:hypothetical protein
MNGRKTTELRYIPWSWRASGAAYRSVEMRKSSTVVALAVGAILTWATAGSAQTPQPDPKSANYQAKGEQDKS